MRDNISKRPNFKDYLPENTTVNDIQKMFGANSKLYKYILALDNYIDQLEEGYEQILNAPNPYNEREALSWISTAIEISVKAQGGV